MASPIITINVSLESINRQLEIAQTFWLTYHRYHEVDILECQQYYCKLVTARRLKFLDALKAAPTDLDNEKVFVTLVMLRSDFTDLRHDANAGITNIHIHAGHHHWPCDLEPCKTFLIGAEEIDNAIWGRDTDVPRR